MQDYLNQHEMWKLDIEEVNGMYSDNQMILKIIRGLTTQYDPFVIQYYFLQDFPGIPARFIWRRV